MSRCGVNFFLEWRTVLTSFPERLIWKPSSLKCLLTSFVCSLTGSLSPFLFYVKVCGLHIFSPALQMVFSSRRRVFGWTIFFFNLQRSRVYQGSVCRWCFWCQLLRISFPSHRFQRIFLKNIFTDVYGFCTLYLSLHSLFRAGVGRSVVRATHLLFPAPTMAAHSLL